MRIYVQKKFLCLLACLQTILIPVCASGGWSSYIIHFNKSLYGKGTQTWQIVPYDGNWVYFANKNGMVQFDGDKWTVFPLNNFSDVRSIMLSAEKKRIYVGGINEFGYYEPAEDGALAYRCMSDTLDAAYKFIGNIWGIYESDNILYFQGDDRVLKLLGNEYTAIKMQGKIDCSNMINNVLYVGTDRGVWILVGNAFMPLRGAEALASKRIRGIVPYKEGVLVATAYDGLYYCNGYEMEAFVTGAEDFMRVNEVFSVAKQGDKIALGTIHKGLLVIDSNTREIAYFNDNNGLRNNTVLSVSFDALGNLWAGLDSGIDYICLSSPFTNLYSYPYSYGTGYAAAVEDGRLYLGTNRGLYYSSYPVKQEKGVLDIHPIPQSSGQVWNLCRVGDELFCLHDRGVFRVNGTSLERITDITGAWCCQPVLEHADCMYVGTYNGIYLLKKQAGNWVKICRISGMDDSCRLFEQESARVIWIYNVDHVTRIKLDETLHAVTKLKEYNENDGFPVSRYAYVGKVEGRICFATPKGIYRHNADTDRMEPYPELNNLLNGSSRYSRLVEYGNKLISLSPHEICVATLGAYKRGGDVSINLIRQSLVELVPDYETVIPLTDSLMIVPNEGGFALFQMPRLHKRKSDRVRSLYIKNMYLSYPKDSLVYTANFLGKKTIPQIDYAMNSVRFDYGLSFMESGSDVRFQYRLNQERWSDFTDIHTKEYSNLFEGNYCFEVQAIFPDGTVESDSFSFVILPPWYRTMQAYICYFLMILMFMWGIYRWDTLRVRREKKRAVIEKDREMHEMEKEYEAEKAKREKQIMELEKEKLEYDLQHKSQEMANLMINFLRKNEMLTEIKSEIVKVAATLKGESAREGKQKLLLINNKIDANIQSDEVLKRIEDQFDLIHNNFMKRLHAKHPDLSNNECMMCAYLKMDLSTKEIAPLLNISVRGVETVRYRLRKKFGLEREDSLTDYLNHKL